jgi:hypothetical protein
MNSVAAILEDTSAVGILNDMPVIPLQGRRTTTNICDQYGGYFVTDKDQLTVPIYNKGDKTDCHNYHGLSLVNYIQSSIRYPSVKVNSICRGNYWGTSV